MVLVGSICSYSGNARNSPYYDHYGHHTLVSIWGQLENMREKKMSKDKIKWHKYPEKKPPKEDFYIIQYKEGKTENVADTFYSNGEFEDFQDCEVTEWVEESALDVDCRLLFDCETCCMKKWCDKWREEV